MDAAATDDKLGVVSFTGDQSECNDDSELRHDLLVVDDTNRGIAKNKIDDITAGGWTGIGDGLIKAQDRIDAIGIPSAVDHIVLLSDGMENEARCWDSSLPGCTNGPSPCNSDVKPVFSSGSGSDTIIDTIAFGPQTDQNLMQDIAATGTGDYYYVDVTDTGASAASLRAASTTAAPALLDIGNRISDVYLSINDNIQKKDRIFFETRTSGGATNHGIGIKDGKLAMAVFAFGWETPKAITDIKLYDPNGNVVGAGDADIYSDDTHMVFQFNKTVPGGQWAAEIKSDSSTQYFIAVSGKFTQGVQADLYFSQVPTQYDCYIKARFLAGLPITILASLADIKGGIRGADVLATIDTPEGDLVELILYDDGQPR